MVPPRRRRIPMKKIDSQSNLEVTFSKRRNGVFRKASELSRLCDCDVGIVIHSPGDNIFAFGEPSVEPILETFMNQNPDEPNNMAEHLMADQENSESRELDGPILDAFMNQNPDEPNIVAEQDDDVVDDDDDDDEDNDDDDEWCELNRQEMTEYKATIEAEKTRGKTIADELPNDPSEENCSKKWWLASVEDLTVDEAEKMLEELERFKHLNISYEAHPETSSSRQTNEVSRVVPQGGGLPSTPDPNLASTSGSRIDKGKAPMPEY